MSANSIYWPKTPDGICLIKSRYKLLLEEDGEDVAGVATANVMKGVCRLTSCYFKLHCLPGCYPTCTT